MIKHLFILLLTVVFTQDLIENVTESYNNGFPKTIKYFTSISNAIELSKIKTFHENGKVENEINYNNGEYDGEWISYYENGQLLVFGLYDNGKKDGKWLTYHENGQKISSENYQDNILHGEWYTYFANGQTKYNGKYIDGKKDGKWIVYYESGRKKIEEIYKDGLRDGNWIEYSEDRKKIKKITYRDGLLIKNYWTKENRDYHINECIKNTKKITFMGIRNSTISQTNQFCNCLINTYTKSISFEDYNYFIEGINDLAYQNNISLSLFVDFLIPIIDSIEKVRFKLERDCCNDNNVHCSNLLMRFDYILKLKKIIDKGYNKGDDIDYFLKKSPDLLDVFNDFSDEDYDQLEINFKDWEDFDVPPSENGEDSESITYDEFPISKSGKSISENLEYPELAIEMELEGKVIVKFFVDEKGKVREDSIQMIIGNPIFEEAAVTAVSKSEWKPALRKNTAVGVWMKAPLVFKLKDAK